MTNRTPSNAPPAFQHQVRGANSPFQATRSPAMPPHAQPQMPNMQNGGPMSHPYGYPPHIQQVNPPSFPVPQRSSSRNVSSTTGSGDSASLSTQSSKSISQPHVTQMQSQIPDVQVFLTSQQGPAMYMPQEYSYGQYPGYPQQPGFMPPQMYQQVPHPSMSPQPPTQFRPQPPYAPGPYQAAPGAQSMSRQASQTADPRPSSSMGHSPVPHGPQASPSPGPTASSNFTRAPKKSSAIRITDADGKVVDFKKTVQSPVTTTPSKGPAVVTSGGTAPATATPPRVVTPAAQHIRTESVQTKTAEERKKEFEEAVKRQVEQEKKDGDAKLKAQQENEEPATKPAADIAPRVEEKAAETEEEPATAAKGETDEERKKREEEEDMERMIAEMEAEQAEADRKEEEREKEYALKKKEKQEEEKRKAAEAAANADEEMKRLEREAEAREEAKSKGKTENDSDAEAQNLFAKLKKNTTLGPGAAMNNASETSTPGSESPMPPPAQPASATKLTPLASKQKPAALKLETTKTIEPAQPTAGMQALKTARFLEIRNEAINYPEGIKSPNPALNQIVKGRGTRYDNNFLLQFREVFKEKPSIDWDKVVKETVGDGTDSARPQSARTPSMAQGGRSMSGRPGGAPAMGTMGSFTGGNRTLPTGTTSEQRFQASMQSGSRPAMPAAGAFGSFPAGRPGAFPMGAPGMIRTPSSQSMQGMNSPRNASQRGKGSRRGGPHPAQEAEMQKKMPLTAGMQIVPLEMSQSGWKPTSLTQPAAAAGPVPGGHLPPDLVQRKVKAALNKMTPEKFDKISNDILSIASQSKDETDGRTLRQVIQLTFEKACDEAHWSSMYAKFCERMLQDMGPDIRDEGVKDKHGAVVVGGALFRKYLLNRCQEEFERGWEVNLPEKPEGQSEEVMLSEEYYIAAAAKRRGLGLIQFIGELYKLGMLTLRIMHECVVKLLNFEGTPDEAAIESLVKLLRTIGATMDADPKGHSMMDTYIDRIQTIMKIDGIASRMYYMLLDTNELRRKQWRSKDDQKGPKTITEIREEAQAAQQAAELERQRGPRGGPGGRMPGGRGDARSFSGGGMPAPDYPRNQVGMDDLKKLTRNARTTSQAQGGLGPTSLLSSSRQGSRRGGLGPRLGEESGASSRTNTPPVKEKESAAHVNAYRYAFHPHMSTSSSPKANNLYSALAALDGDHPDDVASPPSQHASPAITKAQPTAAGETDAGK
jgi:translation initiation factor 4G